MENFTSPKTLRIVGIILVILIVLDIIVHIKSMAKPPVIPPPNVVIQKPKLIKMAEYVTQTGTTIAFNAVNLVARIEGYLEKITFVDGTYLKKGQPLFVIEPLPYMEKWKAAKAAVAGHKANLIYTKSEYARQQKMYKQNATSLNNVEKWLAQSEESSAAIDKAIADETLAGIKYSYTHVSAPFDGRIGRHLVDVGNLVGNGVATKLATIEQISPLYVYFNLNEIDVIRLRDAIKKEGQNLKETPDVTVMVKLQSSSEKEYPAKLDFINTGLNAATGTLEIRAILPNKDIAFVPGLFVEVKAPITLPTPQLTVPETAIMYDQVGNYVLTVDNKNIVQLKRVTLGGVEKGQRAVLKGIVAEDNVIVSGLHNASPGNPVTIINGNQKS